MTTLEGIALKVLLIGSTHYIETGSGQEAAIYYESEKVAHMRIPDGITWRGDLQLHTDGYHVTWQNGPQGAWKIGFAPGKFVYLDGEGKDRGSITKIVPGNPEDFG